MGVTRSLVHPCLTTTIKRAAGRRARSDRKRTCARWRELRSLVHSVAVRTGGRGRKRDRTEGLPVVRWQAQGCALRSPQQIVCRRRAGSPAAVAAHKCFATLALVLPFARRRTYQLSIWAKKRDDRPKTRKRDCTSRGQSTRRHDRRRVFAGLLVAPVFLLEGNSVTARLNFETPARLSLAALERLTLRAVYQAHNTTARLYNDSECHHDTRKTHLIDQLHRRRA